MSHLSVEPPFWWSGMKKSRFQIFIRSNESLGDITPTITSQDISVLEIVHLENPHYLIIYLDIANALPQKFDIDLHKGEIIHYELLQRQPNSSTIEGFDSSDVVYIIMPDRFARSPVKPSKADDQETFNFDERIVEEDHKAEEREKSRKANESAEIQLRHSKNAESADGFEHSPVESAIYETFVDPITNTERVFYEVNRQDPNSRHGGNLQGIIDHLDYIEELGITTVWLNPIFDNDMPHGSYHGYAITDFYNVDPRFGSNSDLCFLIDRLHEKGLKFVMDMIFNHCGSNHIWYRDKPTHDWFNLSDKGVITNHAGTTSFSPYKSKIDWEEFNLGSFVSVMPDLNQRNPHLAAYLSQNSIWWIEFAKINGIRLDTLIYCDPTFIHDWIEDVMTEYPNFNIVGEVWIEDPAGISYFQKGNKFNNNNLPTIMDFQLYKQSIPSFTEETAPFNGLTLAYNHLNYDFVYPDVFHLLRFLENHDTKRFLLTKPENLNAFKGGMAFLLTIPGIPQLYYGTEILMYGDKNHSDGYIRLDFPGGWKTDKQNCFVESGRSQLQNEAFTFLKTLLHWRKGNKAISKGSMIHFKPFNGIYVIQRKYKNRSAIILINGITAPAIFVASRYREILTETHIGIDIFTKKEIDLSRNLEMKPRDVLILEMQ